MYAICRKFLQSQNNQLMTVPAHLRLPIHVEQYLIDKYPSLRFEATGFQITSVGPFEVPSNLLVDVDVDIHALRVAITLNYAPKKTTPWMVASAFSSGVLHHLRLTHGVSNERQSWCFRPCQPLPRRLKTDTLTSRDVPFTVTADVIAVGKLFGVARVGLPSFAEPLILTTRKGES